MCFYFTTKLVLVKAEDNGQTAGNNVYSTLEELDVTI